MEIDPKNIRFKKNFAADRISYRFLALQDYEIFFQVIYGVLPDGHQVGGFDEWGYPMPSTSLLEGVKNPAAVIRKVLELLREYVAIHRPPYFTFSALDMKRLKFYLRLSQRITDLTGYRMTTDKSNYESSVIAFFRPTMEEGMES